MTAVPITSSTTGVFPFQVMLSSAETGIRVDSKAQAKQVHSVFVDRIGPVISRLLPTHLIIQLDEALRWHVQL